VKKLVRTFTIILIIGFVFKLYHFPGASLMLILGVFLCIIHSIIQFFKNILENRVYATLHGGLIFWAAYFLFRIQFYPGAQLFAIIAVLISCAWVLLVFIKASRLTIPQSIYMFLIAFGIWTYFIPAHEVFYVINFSDTFNKDKEIDYFGWDRYSWFLYIGGETKGATKANANAQQAFEERKSRMLNPTEEIGPLLLERRKKILSKTWVNPDNPPLPY